MHVCRGVVRKLKIAAGSRIPFGACDVLLVDGSGQTIAALEKTFFRVSKLKLRGQALLQVILQERDVLLRDLRGFV